jgi:hypothetical protein
MRRFVGGGSVDPQYSTELLVSSRKMMTYPPEMVCRAGLRWAGEMGSAWWLWPGKCFSLFFCFISFLLLPVFCFAISNTNLLICFAGFELVT